MIEERLALSHIVSYFSRFLFFVCGNNQIYWFSTRLECH